MPVKNGKVMEYKNSTKKAGPKGYTKKKAKTKPKSKMQMLKNAAAKAGKKLY